MKRNGKSQRKAAFGQVTIVAPGLLGGSLGMALRERHAAREVVVWARRPENADAAVRKGAADRKEADLAEAVRGADLVVLCCPIDAMPALARKMKRGLSKKTLVTDVGSVKYEVVRSVGHALGKSAPFIGSHPMAGSERSGLAAAKSDLFEGSVCLLTPTDDTSETRLEKLAQFWRSVGCRIGTLSPSDHDEVVARISHLPHLTAGALINLASRHGAEVFRYVGNGFRDMTRIASGPPELWVGICEANREEIVRALDEMIDQLSGLRRILANADMPALAGLLRKAKALRDDLPHHAS